MAENYWVKMEHHFKFIGDAEFGRNYYRVLLCERSGFAPQIHLQTYNRREKGLSRFPRSTVVLRLDPAIEIANSILRAAKHRAASTEHSQ